jgi:LAO/AO transport system kinase
MLVIFLRSCCLITERVEKIIGGNRRALAKTITLLESKRQDHQDQAQQILEKLLPHSGKSIRVGITGVPGVGKSTFIESFGLYLISQGHKVSVLAVDPSSPITGGSILGDKTRMEELSQQHEAFIRPSPSGCALGGVAQKTRESMLVCESGGYDVILVETVGVGQSEVEVAAMVDFFLVLMLPNAGDELQGIKKGILELADAIVINKADGDNENAARQARLEYKKALHLLKPTNAFWSTETRLCSALENRNIPDVWEMILDYKSKAEEHNYWEEKRAGQNTAWMWKLIQEKLMNQFKQQKEVQQHLPSTEDDVNAGKTTPFTAANELLGRFFSNLNYQD